MPRAFHIGPTICLIVFALSLTGLCIAGSSPPDDVKRAAVDGLKAFVKDGRMGKLRQLGFDTQADIDYSALGKGFQIFTIPPDRLLNGSAPQDIQTLAIPTNQWQFQIVTGDKAKALLTVDIVNGVWTTVSIGSSGLAQQLAGFLASWPPASGYDFRLIRVYQAKSDFIELSKGGKVLGIVPLTSLLAATSGGSATAYDPRSLRDPNEVLSNLRPVVKRNLLQDGKLVN